MATLTPCEDTQVFRPLTGGTHRIDRNRYQRLQRARRRGQEHAAARLSSAADGAPDEEIEAAGVYLPNPEEIRAACLEIQKEWTPLERLVRSGRAVLSDRCPVTGRPLSKGQFVPRSWRPPVCRAHGGESL